MEHPGRQPSAISQTDAGLSQPMPESFLIIDDHPLFCEALALTLGAMRGDIAVATARSLAEGLERIAAGCEPDAVLLDLNLPDVEGVEGLLRLRAARPATPVVVISSLRDSAVIARVIRAGAVGFISKDAGRAEIAEAFRRIWTGDVYTPADYAPPAPADDTGDPGEDVVARLADLTPQQTRILQLVCDGKLNKQIAYDLSIAESTVKAHMTAILRKLRVQSRTQAVLAVQKARFRAEAERPAGG